jgi:hypothetical protein
VLFAGVDQVLQVDLSFLLLASKTLEFLNPELRRLSLGDIASDIKTTMLDELDFTKVIDKNLFSAPSPSTSMTMHAPSVTACRFCSLSISCWP